MCYRNRRSEHLSEKVCTSLVILMTVTKKFRCHRVVDIEKFGDIPWKDSDFNKLLTQIELRHLFFEKLPNWSNLH